MFTTEHFIWIALCAVFIVAMTFISIKLKFSFKTSAIIMAIISLLSESAKIISDMKFVNKVDSAQGMVLNAKALPFHLCSLLIFVFFYLPFCKNEKLKSYFLNLFVPVGLIGATLAVLMATSGTDFCTSNAYQCFVYHAGMIWFAIYLVITKQVDLGFKSWKTNVISLACLSVIMIWVNSVLQVYDTNFLYVVRPPAKNLPLLNLNNGWFVYFITLVLLGLIGVTLVHAPTLIKQLKNKNK